MCVSRQKLRSEREVAEVRAAADTELKSQLLSTRQEELSRREKAVTDREAVVAEAERSSREQAAALRERLHQEGSALSKAQAEVTAQQEELKKVGGTSTALTQPMHAPDVLHTKAYHVGV